MGKEGVVWMAPVVGMGCRCCGTSHPIHRAGSSEGVWCWVGCVHDATVGYKNCDD